MQHNVTSFVHLSIHLLCVEFCIQSERHEDIAEALTVVDAGIVAGPDDVFGDVTEQPAAPLLSSGALDDDDVPNTGDEEYLLQKSHCLDTPSYRAAANVTVTDDVIFGSRAHSVMPCFLDFPSTDISLVFAIRPFSTSSP